MTARIYRDQVPVDDQTHVVELNGGRAPGGALVWHLLEVTP